MAATSHRALSLVLVLSALVCAATIGIVLWHFGGWEYYRTPTATRGYLAAHRLLRPSGSIGLPLGVIGMFAMISTLPYAARKRWRPLARLGATSKWLEAHIFFGIVGPVLVTLHTAFKFKGGVAVGYWLMMAVWSSGFVGRYLYVRIPRTMRGVDLTRQEIEAELMLARAAVAAASLPAPVRAALDDFDRSITPSSGRAPGVIDLFFGELRVRARLLMMRRHLRSDGAELAVVHTAVACAAEHATLTRRLVHLERTRHFFELWHVFHRPLVYGMFAIVGLHVALAFYLGYAQLLTLASR